MRRRMLGPLVSRCASPFSGAAAAPKARLERTVIGPPGARFVLDADGGSVVVRGTSRSDAHLVATSNLEDLESKFKIEIKESAGEVRVVSRKEEGIGQQLVRLLRQRQLEPQFEVEVPERTPVQIDTAGERERLRARVPTPTSTPRAAHHRHRSPGASEGRYLRRKHPSGQDPRRRRRADRRRPHRGARHRRQAERRDQRRLHRDRERHRRPPRRDLRGIHPHRRCRRPGRGRDLGGSVEATFTRGNDRGGVLDSSAGSVRVNLDPTVNLLDRRLQLRRLGAQRAAPQGRRCTARP